MHRSPLQCIGWSRANNHSQNKSNNYIVVFLLIPAPKGHKRHGQCTHVPRRAISIFSVWKVNPGLASESGLQTSILQTRWSSAMCVILEKTRLSRLDKNSAWKSQIQNLLQVASDVMSLSRESVYLTIASSGEVSNVDLNGIYLFPHDVSLSSSNVRWNLFIQLNWLYQHSSVISLQCIGWADPVQWCARITGESAGQLQLSCPGWAPLQYSASEVDQSTLDSRSVWCPVQQFTCLPQVSPWHPAL